MGSSKTKILRCNNRLCGYITNCNIYSSNGGIDLNNTVHCYKIQKYSKGRFDKSLKLNNGFLGKI